MTETSAQEVTTVTTPASRRRIWVGAGVLLALVAVVGWRVLDGPGVPARPYADPSAIGRLTLCNGATPVTGGSTTAPLGTAVRAEHLPTSGVATLYAFQPRLGVDSDAWSGLALSAPSAITPRQPLASLAGSLTVRQFVGSFPATDQGYVELRLSIKQVGSARQATTYDALDLYVHGDTWTAVQSGSGSCQP